MSKFLFLLILICILVTPVSATEITAPVVPESGAEHMPDADSSFGDGLLEMLQSILSSIRPDLYEAASASLGIIAAVMIVSILQSFDGSIKFVADYAGAIVVAATLLLNANTMIRLGSETISELSEYGKLLFPVMTTAMAAQGGITSSAALYTGTAVFSTILSNLISNVMVPGVYLFLALATANSAMGEDLLKNIRDLLKQFISWILKILLTVFTTYISITGVVSGNTDAATLKATKVTISSFVPVVGGILSDASEAVLVSVGLAKNAAGIYGIFAILALFLDPFLRIGTHYLMLKAVSAICALFGSKRMCDLIGDFSTAMGLILGMTGTVCLLLLIGTICIMKGVG